MKQGLSACNTVSTLYHEQTARTRAGSVVDQLQVCCAVTIDQSCGGLEARTGVPVAGKRPSHFGAANEMEQTEILSEGTG